MKILSFEQEFCKRQPKRVHVLKFIREVAGVKEVNYSDLTLSTLEATRNIMSERLAQNSAQVYCAILKAFLNDISEEVELPTKKFKKALTIRKVPSEQVILNEDEIGRIEKYVPKTKYEKWVKAQFLCEYYCMARTSDIQMLTDENIRGGFITYVSKKTKTLTSVPLHEKFMEYFSQRGEPMPSMTFNRIIKRICRNVGITEQVKIFYHGKTIYTQKCNLVASHTARRSAASELARRNVPISTISQLMNHAGHITTTQRYIFADTRNLGEETMSFFRK